MREIWDDLWDKRGVLDVEKIVRYDACYHLLSRLIELRQNKNLNILEVGCGSGIYTIALLRESQNNSCYNAVLVDFSSIALSLARRNAAKNGVDANFVLADAFQLPFPDGTFDIVCSEGVNEHVEDEKRQLIFNEMARVCKLRGQVVVIVPNSLNIAYRLWKKILEVQGKWQYGFEMPYSIFELKRRMKNAGLIPIKVNGRGTLASLSLLVEVVSGKSGNKLVDACPSDKLLGILRKTVMKTDRMLGFVGGFTGVEIGVKGIKST